MSAHREWTKALPNGKRAKFIYDEIAGICSVVVYVNGSRVLSRADLAGPLTKEQVELMFLQSFAHHL
jgi:hypothetical protein